MCHELQGNLVVSGNMFSLVPEAMEYKVVRWTSDEIVATSINGICKALNSLKFDRKNKRVYAIQSLSEPIENLPKMSRDICNAVGSRWELRGETMYWQRPTLQNLHNNRSMPIDGVLARQSRLARIVKPRGLLASILLGGEV